MKTLKFNILALLTIAANVTFAAAQSSSLDTTYIKSPDEVILSQHDDTLSIQVKGQEGTPGFRYERTVVLENNSESVVKQTRNTADERALSWSLFESSLKKSTLRIEFSADMDWGFLFPLNRPSGMGNCKWKSFETNFNLIKIEYLPINPRWRFACNLGVNYRHIEMGGKSRFLADGDGAVSITDYPEGAKPRCSMLDILSTTTSLNAYYQYSKMGAVSLGVICDGVSGVNQLPIARNIYKDAAGKRVVDTQSIGSLRHNHYTFRLGIDAHCGKEDIGLYVKYSPWSIFKSGKGPNFASLSVGVHIKF